MDLWGTMGCAQAAVVSLTKDKKKVKQYWLELLGKPRGFVYISGGVFNVVAAEV